MLDAVRKASPSFTKCGLADYCSTCRKQSYRNNTIFTKLTTYTSLHDRDWAQAVCVKVCQLLAVGRWFPPGTPVSSTSETDISSSSLPVYDLGCCWGVKRQ